MTRPNPGVDAEGGADLPSVLGSTAAIMGDLAPGASGALWKLAPAHRQLDANLIRLPSGDTIEPHVVDDVDVLQHVVYGSGQVITAAGPVDVAPGSLVWLPRGSRRAIVAGPDGLIYLSVHRRRPGLTIGTGPA